MITDTHSSPPSSVYNQSCDSWWDCEFFVFQRRKHRTRHRRLCVILGCTNSSRLDICQICMNTQPFVLKKHQHFPHNPLQLRLIFIAFPGRRPPCMLRIVMINTDIVQSPGMRIRGDAHCESAPKLIQK